MILGEAQGPADLTLQLFQSFFSESRSQSLKSLRHVCVSESFLPGVVSRTGTV